MTQADEKKLVEFMTTGYGVEPCPGCNQTLQPKQPLAVVPGEWRSWHVDCYHRQSDQPVIPETVTRTKKTCTFCRKRHTSPFDGSCLL